MAWCAVRWADPTCSKSSLYTGCVCPVLSRPSLALPRLLADGTVPCPSGLALQPNAAPVEPLIRTIVVVACHHVAVTNVLAQAILLVVTPFVFFFFFLGVFQYFVAILVFAIHHRSTSGAPVTAFLVTASTLSVG